MRTAWRKEYMHSGFVLVPAEQAAQDWFDGLRDGQVVHGHLARKRSVQHNAKYWALLRNIAAVLPHWDTASLHIWVKVRTGNAIIRNMPGIPVPVYVPASTSFDSMDQVAFDAFYEQAIKELLEHMVPQIPIPKHREMIEQELIAA